MKVCGIVVEYNPFHNGHILHIEQARAKSGCDLLIAVMSPHFVQRGEPRHRRLSGNEQERPCTMAWIWCWSCRPSTRYKAPPFFASAAVDILALAGADTIVFGSESNDIDRLRQLAETLTDFCHPQGNGISTVRQYEALAGPMSPNDILGLCYIRAAQAHQLRTVCIQRTNAYHDTGIDTHIASATAIRTHFLQGENVSAFTPMQAAMHAAHTMETLYPYLQTRLLLDDPEDMKRFFLMDEGIEPPA